MEGAEGDGVSDSTSTAPRVAILILTWNRRDDLVGCLESFKVLDYPNYEAVVLDNGSEDDSVGVARERYPWATVVENGQNLGFCRGNNAGLRWALEHDFPYVMLLNSDTEVTPRMIQELVDVMEADPTIGIAGAKNVLLENPDLTWGKYGKVTWGPMLVRQVGRMQLDDRRGDPPLDVDWVIMNACLMRRDALLKVGLLDEEFWQCNEDVDWCYRARNAGYRVVYVDRAAIRHMGGSSADVKYGKIFSYGYFIGRNAFTFAKKHGTRAQQLRLLCAMTAGVFGRLLFFFIHNVRHAVLGQRTFVRGMWDGMRGRLDLDQVELKITEAEYALRPGLLSRFARWLGA